MNLDLRELLNGNPVRLRYVYRYSTTRVSHPESVAEHSYFVAFYCMMIGLWYEDNKAGDGESLNMRKLLQRAIVHDLEEARSGDFPRNFKHSSPSVEEMLEDAGAMAFLQIEKALCPGEEGPISVIWTHAKDSSIEGRVLEFADFLSVLSFMMQENCSAGNGNRLLEQHVAGMGDYFKTFSSSKFDFIRPLVDQAAVLMKETFNGRE